MISTVCWTVNKQTITGVLTILTKRELKSIYDLAVDQLCKIDIHIIRKHFSYCSLVNTYKHMMPS